MTLTITSDKGTAHGWPASMEAAILQQQNDVQIVHVTHHIPAGDVVRAAYAVTELISCYPAETVHLVAVGLVPGICPPHCSHNPMRTNNNMPGQWADTVGIC